MAGELLAASQFGLQLLAIKPNRQFSPSDSLNTTLVGPIIAHATIEEVHTDEMEITEHPIEQGSVVADHAFARPSELLVTCGWSNSPNNSGPLNQLLGGAVSASPVIQSIAGVAEAALGVANLTIFGQGALSLVGGAQDAVRRAYSNLLASMQNRLLFDVVTGKRSYKGLLIRELATTTDRFTENSLLIRITFRQILMAQTETTMLDNSVMKNPEINGASNADVTVTPVPKPNVRLPSFLEGTSLSFRSAAS